MRHLFVKMSCSGCGETFNVPVYCGNRFCPVCSIRRNNRVRKRLGFLSDHCDRPRKHWFKHLTLTISNQPNLEGMVTEIVKSFRKLRNRQYWKNNVDGGAYVIEIKGSPGNWHVHIHAIIMSRYMPFDRLLQLWMKVSSGRGVYIQRVPASAVVNYLSKYLTKPDVSDLVLCDINEEMASKRLFSPFGSWHSLSREYVAPVHLCSRCGYDKYMPWDLMYGKPPQPFYADSG